MNNEIPIIEPIQYGYWALYPESNQAILYSDLNGIKKIMKFSEYKKAEKEYNIGGGDWLKLKEGANKVRIVSEFEAFGNHYIPEEKKSVVCLGKDKCPLCKKGDKPSVRYLGWVIDREDGNLKMAMFGHTIFKAIGELAMSEDYSFEGIPDYDVTIKRTGTGLDTQYTVIPARKETKLTKDEEKMLDEMKDPKDVLEKMKENQSPDKEEGENEDEEHEIRAEDLPY